MHVHPAQQETDLNKLHDFIERNAFALLAVVCDGKIEANHLPVELDRKSGPFGTIRCHIGRNNPAYEIIAKADEALFIFQGPHAYFSPDFHPGRKTHGKAAPSWNYQVVHAQGPLSMKTDAIWLRRHLHKLTQINERQRDNPWKMGEAPKPFIDASIAAIVGMEVKLHSLIGKNQAGQQYKPETREAIANNLRAENSSDTDAIAELIENTPSANK